MGSLTAIKSISGSDGYREGCPFSQMVIITTRKIERMDTERNLHRNLRKQTENFTNWAAQEVTDRYVIS